MLILSELNIYLSLLFAEILIAPQTQHALLNAEERATFFCQATGANVYWSINGETVFAEGDAKHINQGWIFTEDVNHNVQRQSENVHNLTMEIPTTLANNNTRVQCVGVIHDPAFSDPAYLIVKSESLVGDVRLQFYKLNAHATQMDH